MNIGVRRGCKRSGNAAEARANNDHVITVICHSVILDASLKKSPLRRVVCAVTRRLCANSHAYEVEDNRGTTGEPG